MHIAYTNTFAAHKVVTITPKNHSNFIDWILMWKMCMSQNDDGVCACIHTHTQHTLILIYSRPNQESTNITQFTHTLIKKNVQFKRLIATNREPQVK